MEQEFDTPGLLAARQERVLLDVRSPGEYEQGHIPGAISFPLFSDAERAQVGTAYKQLGPEMALQIGLDLVGPKMAGFITQALELAPGRKLAVHCWRGGQRSKSMAWLLRMAGCEVVTLQGGYKAYRRYLLDQLNYRPWPLLVLGGRTGSGKTHILHAMRRQGAQIIDLEGLANHKGSAFGWIGEAPQPTVEQFENNLFEALQHLDTSRNIWIENESRSIGRVFLPDGFWRQLKAAPIFNIVIPHQQRLDNLVLDYTRYGEDLLIEAFMRIDKKLGGQHLKAALEALKNGDYRSAAEIALVYYDKTYQFGLDSHTASSLRHFQFESADPEFIAKALLEATQHQPLQNG